MKTYYFVFCKESLLVEQRNDGTYSVPLSDEPPTNVKPWTTVMNITPLDGTPVKAYSTDNANANGNFVPLRQSYYLLPLEQYIKAGKCAELLYWNSNTRYCGVCGGLMKFHTDISKRCEQCGKEVWPQVSPAIIVRITRGKDEILMARAHNFRRDFYGLIAGFVETGETLEEAVKREVSEETGLNVKNIRYFESQPWPYPCGIMVGFTAEYDSGQIHIQHEELQNVAWFRRDRLPNLPEPLSIARHLIDDWLNNKKDEKTISSDKIHQDNSQ